MIKNKLVVIGGSDAGISASLRARELSPNTEVAMILADRYPNFSICGLPFYLSGEVTDWKTLAHRTADEIEKQGIRLFPDHRATAIIPDRKEVLAADAEGRSKTFPYDRLVIGIGGVSLVPNLPGIDLPGVFFLRWVADSFAFQEYLASRRPKSIVIIGAGYIGMEMADAMIRRGLSVSVVEFLPSVLTTFDPALGGIVRTELEQQGVQVFNGFAVERIEPAGNRLSVRSVAADIITADMVLVAVGSRPESDLARSAGIETGVKGAICVNRRMETNIPHIYAAGDCAETYHRLLGKNTYLPLGTTAHKQGRIAGENTVGGNREYSGTLGTQSVKIFNRVAARTGLKDDEALKEGFSPLSVDVETWDHKAYYPHAKKMRIRITGDKKTGKLLGAQIIGAYGAEVSKRIDTVAAAIHNGMTMEALNDLDLAYTPPLSSPWDPVQMAAQAWSQANGRPV
ncbi:MAG: CoA-disulfide reductase [Syntrophus sp. RIFOXYC2_FULL_54_9]|nr:MAG: CoA-disulfide reductase [Syntrophus sp. GWC2_56_31]OHE25160.1 MAG: CoA-disulfide reductase [Syntrophus sp. RIFOXYC2_FULL_54_9]HBB16784.1 CoA-disulfide reductase [Syntrophus sp. (in: bacteria)]